jgi:hypothetical protein
MLPLNETHRQEILRQRFDEIYTQKTSYANYLPLLLLAAIWRVD